MASTATRPRGSLQPNEIIETAAELIRAGGLDAFSMRKLAAELGVTPMTLYSRFENKDDLLAAVAAHILGAFQLPATEGPWVDQVVALAAAIRSHLIASRAVLPLLHSHDELGPAMLDATEAGLGLMEEIGFVGPEAVDAFRSLFWHAVGFAMVDGAIAAGQVDTLRRAHDDPHTDHPVFTSLVGHFSRPDPSELFEHTTRALAVGLAHRTGRTPT